MMDYLESTKNTVVPMAAMFAAFLFGIIVGFCTHLAYLKIGIIAFAIIPMFLISVAICVLIFADMLFSEKPYENLM